MTTAHELATQLAGRVIIGPADCYEQGKVTLLPATAGGSSLEHLCIAAHEAAHAQQEREGSRIWRTRMRLHWFRRVSIFCCAAAAALLPTPFFRFAWLFVLAAAATSLLRAWTVVRCERQASAIALLWLFGRGIIGSRQLGEARAILDAMSASYWRMLV